MLTKGAIGNLVNRYRAVLKKCNLINTFGSLAVASMLVLGGAGVANAAEYDKAGFAELGTQIKVTEDIKVTGASMAGVASIKTSGTFEWFGEGNDTAEMTTAVEADTFIYRGHIGNQQGRFVSGKINVNNLIIMAEKDTTNATQKGLKVRNDAVLNGVKAIRIESKNDGLACLGFDENLNTAINADITLAHDGSGNQARIELEKGASVAFGNVIAESGKSKVQINHTASASFDSVTVKDNAYFSLDMWTNAADQTASFTLNEIVVGNDAQFRISPYNANKPQVDVNGDMAITLGKNGIVDLGGERNSDWDSDTIKINSENIQITVTDINSDSHVYLSAEGTDLTKTNVQVTASGESNTGDVNANLNKLAGIVELTSNVDPTDGTADTTATKSAAAGTKLSIGEGMHAGAATATVGAEGQLENVNVKTNSVMANVLDIASSQALSMNRILMNDVRKRLGDIRAAEGTHGAWMRYDGGSFSGSNGYENDFTTFQIGFDTKPTADAPRFGVAFAYTNSDTDMKRGSAEMDAFSLALYGTKMYDNGMFFDVIGRVATADSDIVVDGDKKGSMDNVALSLSGEFGWRFDVAEKFYIEPQTELTYTYITSDDLTLSGGYKYDFDSVDSVIGRVGVATGFKLPNDLGDVYVRASAVHEFLGDAAVRGGGNVHELDGDDTWLEYGIGANVKLTDSTYIWADVERTEGADIDEEWRGTVGVRFSF